MGVSIESNYLPSRGSSWTGLSIFEMDINQFEEALPKFNSLLLEHLSAPIFKNYIRNSLISPYSYTRIERAPKRVDTINTKPLNKSSWRWLSAEFTIHYDNFYRVPLFSFRLDLLLVDSNSYCAIDIHPILQNPWIYMHPCETSSTMDGIGWTDDVDYLVKWIGMVFLMVLPDIQMRYIVQ